MFAKLSSLERRQSDNGRFVCEEINLEGLQNDNEDMFAKLSSLERRQSDSEDSFVKKLI